mgnify:CR=1 FL=1
MTFQKSKLLISTLLVSAACSSQAENYLGASVGSGGVDYTTSQTKPDGYLSANFYYGKSLNDSLFLEAGLITGKSIDYDDEDKDEKDEVELETLYLALKGVLDLSAQHSLYAKAGLQQYQYEVESNGSTLLDKSGLGYSLDLGWEYGLSDKLTTRVQFGYLDLGKLTSNTLQFGIAYSI